MTPKELLYIEDTLGHTKAMNTVFSDCAARLTDPALKNLASELATELNKTFNSFYSLLN